MGNAELFIYIIGRTSWTIVVAESEDGATETIVYEQNQNTTTVTVIPRKCIVIAACLCKLSPAL